jgi:hypothetical protein
VRSLLRCDHHLGLEVLRPVEPHVLLDGHELHLLLEEAVHQLNHLPPTPPQARELPDQDEVARVDLLQQRIHTPPRSCMA